MPHDDELPLGDDAIGMVSEEPAAPDPAGAPLARLAVHTDQADWIATQASERPTSRDRAGRRGRGGRRSRPREEPSEDPDKKPSKKRGRASVPSWDEIMFGGGKGD